MNSGDIKLSKALSWLLRHGALKEGLQLSPEGYLNVDTILQLKSFRNYTLSDIERVVANNEKQRFQLRLDPDSRLLQIKANQGHSIDTVTDAELTPILDAKYQSVIHGTFFKCWPQIKQEGLSRMKRRHIHFARGADNTVISGVRKDAQIHIYINLERALQDGIKFFESNNGVILTAGNDKGILETKYFDKVVEVASACVRVRRHGVMEGCARAPRPPFRVAPAPRHAPPPFARAPPPFAHAPRPPMVVLAPQPARAAPREPRPAPEMGRRRPDAPHDDEDYSRMVLVTGFPPYTRPQDLAHTFARFGAVRVARRRAGAALTLPTADAARAALRAQRDLTLYGEPLLVRPCLGPERDRAAPKQKAPTATVDPNSIPWDGDFHVQLDALLSAVRLSAADVQRLAALYRDLETVLQEAWPGCRAVPFGSVTTGLGVRSSDADCFVQLPRGAAGSGGSGGAVQRARRLLAQHPRLFAELLAIPRANTPIVKCFHLPTRTHADVSFKTPLGAQNSKLVAFLLHADARLLPVAVALKYYAAVHGLSGTGKLTNYALTMLVLFYLQQPPHALLPPVAWLQRDRRAAVLVDGWDTGFAPALLPPARSGASVAELLGGFFEYYAGFDFDGLAVCPYLGRPIPKDAFKDLNLLPAEFELYKLNVATGVSLPIRFNTPMCVQDPFEQCHNVASPVTTRLAADIRAYFQFAADAYRKEKLVECRNFLRTVLLEKPKLPRGKGNPEYRVGISPALLNTFTAPDWKPVARKVILLAFNDILKANLKSDPGTPEKTDNKDKKQETSEAQESKRDVNDREGDAQTEKQRDDPETTLEPEAKVSVNPAAKKEKAKPRREREKYTGSFTRTVWKRRQFQKLFSVMGLKFLDREIKITEEILNFDKNVIKLEFQLLITFKADPRTAIVTIKYVSGDMNNYREFGKFVASTMQNWFMTLCKPHCTPKKRERKMKPKKDKEEKGVEDGETAASAGQPEQSSGDDEPAPHPAEPADPAASDSDSVFSYEDERIDPNAEQLNQNDSDESLSDDDSTPSDANKENVASNSVEVNDSVDKTTHNHGAVKCSSDGNKIESNYDKTDVPEEANGKTKSNNESEKNE